MKTTCNYLISMGILLILLFQSELIKGQTYDPDAAAAYADLWAYKEGDPAYHNPSYKIYWVNNDCANFVSQCLKEGGLSLDAGPDVNSEGCICFCDNLHTNLKSYQNVTYTRKTSGYPTWFTKGDVVLLNEPNDTWAHAMFAATYDTPPLLNAHTTNRYHYSISYATSTTYPSRDFYHITGSSAQAPLNDNCSGAITLTPNTSCNTTSGDIAGASQSISPISCGGYTSTMCNDVWFKFTATSTTHVITVNPSSGLDAVVDLRSGSCNGTNISCSDNGGGENGNEIINASGLNVGSTVSTPA